MKRKQKGQIRSDLASLATSGLIDSRRLLYFYHVARTGSFSVAETVLDVAQPAITRQIQQLETDLRVQLLQRNGRGVSLTPFGEILFRQAEEILGEMSATLEQLRRTHNNPAGQISIAASAGIMSSYMPQILKRFIAAYPEVQVTAIQASTGEVYDQLATGQVDIAIVSQIPNSLKVVRQKLIVEPMYLMVARSHPMANLKFVERDRLSSLELVLPASRHGIRLIIENYCESNGVNPSAHLRIDSVPLIKALVRDGKLCTILPQIAHEAKDDATDFSMIPLRPMLMRTLWVASLVERAKSPLNSALMREVNNAFPNTKSPASDSK
jgi:DNA-binding transcriptional LysR family regulator